MSRRSTAIVLSPEAPWPVIGGGAIRTASLIEYLRRDYDVTVATFREPGAPEPSFPDGISGRVIALPLHSKTWAARVARNLGRCLRGVPPLVDRFGGFEHQLRALANGRQFDIGVIEHFWCAPYASVLRPFCRRLVLDAHNIESVLLHRQSRHLSGAARAVVSRFASCAADVERTWLPWFDTVLVTSEADRAELGTGVVYPNAVPEVSMPDVQKRDEIAFSGNMGYEPNLTAVRWFAEQVWPQLRSRRSGLVWRLIGRNEAAVRGLVGGDEQIVLTGPVDDAVAELAQARLAIVPVQAGSGTRIKIIEAWAAGLPVISTTIGAEGLPAAPGEHLLIADSPSAFLGAIEQVLDSPEIQYSLGSAGRRLYERRLTWQAAWETLEKAGL